MFRYELHGPAAIVTGGGRGIGRAVCGRLAREGADVAVCDIDGDAATSVANMLTEMGRRAMAVSLDVTQRSAVESAIAGVVHEFGRLDILVNCAGVLRVTPVLDIDDAEWDAVMGVNAKGVLICSQAAARVMIAQGWGGRIITIVSPAGRLPSKAPIGSYVASKHAAMGLVQQMGLEFAPDGILVNAVFPGIVDTDMLEVEQRGLASQSGRAYEEVRREDEASIPIGRLQTTDEVANMVAFLASTEANCSVGQAFDVGGGAFWW